MLMSNSINPPHGVVNRETGFIDGALVKLKNTRNSDKVGSHHDSTTSTRGSPADNRKIDRGNAGDVRVPSMSPMAIDSSGIAASENEEGDKRSLSQRPYNDRKISGFPKDSLPPEKLTRPSSSRHQASSFSQIREAVAKAENGREEYSALRRWKEETFQDGPWHALGRANN
jgi:hypothetical protein